MTSISEDGDINNIALQQLRSVLSAVGPDDFERFDPPADLWGRIATSIASAFSARFVVEYWIDGNDIVFPSGDGWEEFALGNAAPELVEGLTGQTLWSQFDGVEVRELWQLVVARVRSEQQTATVPLRCDAPNARRWFEMTVAPGDNQTVHFRSELVFEEPRADVTFLDLLTERDDSVAAVPICSWCGEGFNGTEWVEIEELVRHLRLLENTLVPPLAHGICGTCREAMSVVLQPLS